VFKLSVFPPNLRYEKLFCDQIAKHLHRTSVRRVAIQSAAGDGSEIKVLLDGGAVNEVIWYYPLDVNRAGKPDDGD
jgi:hypothetical protein